MPTVNLEPTQGDGIPQFESSQNFSGGWNSFAKPSSLQPNQYQDSYNLDHDFYGRLVTRCGCEKVLSSGGSFNVIQGFFHYSTPTYNQDLTFSRDNSGGAANYYHTFGGLPQILSGYNVTSGAKMSGEQFLDYLYFVDGAQNVFRWNGSTVQNSTAWGVVTQPPAGLNYLVVHTNRLFGFKGDTIYPSDILSPNFPTLNQVKVGADSGAITGACSWSNNLLIVFKINATYTVDTTSADPADWIITLVQGNVGCASHWSIARTNNGGDNQDVFFLSSDGVRSIHRTLQDGQQDISLPLSFPIDDFIQRINRTSLFWCSGIFFKNRYILSVPLDSAITPNYSIVFNSVQNSWSGYWDYSFAATFFLQNSWDGTQKLYMTGPIAGSITVYQVMVWKDYIPYADRDDNAYRDDRNTSPVTYSEIPTLWISKSYMFNDPMNPKRGSYFELEFNSSDAIVSVFTITDDTDPVQYATGLDTSPIAGPVLPFLLPFTLGGNQTTYLRGSLKSNGRFREIAIQVTSSSGKVQLSALNLAAWIKILRKVNIVA